MNIAQAIKEIRNSRNLTQVQLSYRTRGLVNISTIKRIESGQEVNPTLNTLEALRKALEVDPIEWFFRVIYSQCLPSGEDAPLAPEVIEKMRAATRDWNKAIA
ncbi:helix-turn-helix transcriptional regulator [Deltaproteobacteria bacterium PRO3]|nr:helix-turn-helix transcriptional regulator [Deltaproteobacteria bacterium PRO3]